MMRDLKDEGRAGTEPTRPSRAEIETLCILYAVGNGCSVDELATRIGLTLELVSVMAEAIEPLIESGLIADGEGALSVTDAGSHHLKDRLRTFGLR